MAKKKQSPLRGKGGLVAVAVLVVLGIWLFLDFKRPTTDPNAPKAFESVGVRSEDVTRVELKRPSGTLVLAKAGDTWRFEQPGSYAANPESVKTWLRGLLDDTDARKIEGQADLAKLGLDKPEVEMVLKAGGTTRTLQIGKPFKTPSEAKGSLYYAREASSGRLFMLPAGEAEGLRDKKIDDLRDKRLMVLNDEKDVKMVLVQRGGTQAPVSVAGASGTVHRGGETLVVLRQGDDKWKLDQPFEAPAQTDDVSTLINRLKNAEAESFVEDNPRDLAKYGLDQPRLTAQVTTGKGEKSIRFGKAQKDGKVYAMPDGASSVVLVSKFTWEDLDGQSRPAKLRDRQLVSLDRDKINYLELKAPRGTVRVRKVSAQEWQWVDPKDPKKPKANAEKCRQVLDRVTGPATAHVEEAPRDLKRYGLDKPVITVTVGDGHATSQVVMLGSKTKDGYYAKGQPNAVFEVSRFVFEDLSLKPDDFNDPTK
jgi:hypothetical protein